MRIAPILLVAAAGLGSSMQVAAAQDPSEREMRQAVEAKFRQINAHYRALGKKCERREFRNDPLMAMQCLQLCGAGGGKCSM